MLAMPHYTAFVTLLAIALYMYLATRVAAARGKFGVRVALPDAVPFGSDWIA
jgi:hypothetical protein